MAEGPPERTSRTPLSHLVVPWPASEQAYKGRSGGAAKPIRAIGDRQSHAARLSGELESARDLARAKLAEVSPDVAADGFALSVASWSDEPGYKLAVQSLDTSGAKLLSVTPGTDQWPERAVVWLPFGAVGAFFAKIEQFATETTSRGNPRNQALVANIADLRLAVLHDLWQEPEQFPEADEVRWWEVWLARLVSTPAARRSKRDVGLFPSRQLVGGPGAVLRAVAAARAWQVVPGLLAFPDNVIGLVRASASELGTLLSTSAVPSELHRARVTSEISGLDSLDQDEWVADLVGRIKAAEPDASAVCVLDTGLMSEHPLLRASVDRALSALDIERPGDQAGHGTAMAGLALFRDLDRDLMAKGVVALRHRIESVKVLRNSHDTTNAPEMYPTITAIAIAAVEADHVRRRAFSMAVTVDGSDGSDGHPTSYSAAFDALAFGTDIARSDDGIELLGRPDPHASRLFVLSAGNVPADQWTMDHLALSDVAPVQNPAQAWNALTVGAYTEKVTSPTAGLFRGWVTVATTGELSPFSRTSMTFDRGWPIKPDIVLEGGNLLADPSGTQFDQHDDVSLLTTRNASFRLLTTANATSAATAQAARLAAVAMEQYPGLWPETVRGLLVHAAEWTPAMQAHFRAAGTRKGVRVQLLRRYGWGVPTEQRVLSSAASSVTLILQDEFLPFEPSKSSGITMRALRLHKLPWPQEQLRDLFGAGVRLRVTLSYFVEPNPSSRGWQGKYRYASHGLRFDVKRPTETVEDFQRRLGNQAAREEGGDTPQQEASSDDRWYVGSRLRNSGSLHADIWTGTGAELADSGYIGVIPVGGWWKENDRKDRANLPVRYALLVSLQTDAVAADIYTPIATQIGIPIPISI
jgi:Subtilase family